MSTPTAMIAKSSYEISTNAKSCQGLGCHGTCDGMYSLFFRLLCHDMKLTGSQYLVGLSTLICGYLWFLYHNREVSYRSALNLTISRRQTKLYHAKNFDLQKWEALIEEGNALRKEIKAIAHEYDVEWDERVDEQDEKVTKALKQERDEKRSGDGKKKKAEEDEEDE